MKRNPIYSEYKSGNKWVRAGVYVFVLGLALFLACAVGLIYLSLTDFPSVSVPIPQWMTFCLLGGPIYVVFGLFCIAYGMKPPGGGGRRKMSAKGRISFVPMQSAA